MIYALPWQSASAFRPCSVVALGARPFGTRSVRRNPLIADLLHRIGFIEKAGTGIHRMREDARRHKCPEPKFTANGFFTATFWPTREGIHRGKPIGTKSGPSTEQVAEQVTEQVATMLEAGRRPRTREELQKLAGIKHRPHFLSAYLKPLLEAGWLTMTLPEKPRSPKQRYQTTELGLQALRRQKAGE